MPTFAELGYKIYPRIDRGIMGPRNLPKDVADKLDKAFYSVVTNKEVQAKLREAGFVPNPMNAAQTTKYVRGAAGTDQEASGRREADADQVAHKAFGASGQTVPGALRLLSGKDLIGR